MQKPLSQIKLGDIVRQDDPTLDNNFYKLVEYHEDRCTENTGEAYQWDYFVGVKLNNNLSPVKESESHTFTVGSYVFRTELDENGRQKFVPRTTYDVLI